MHFARAERRTAADPAQPALTPCPRAPRPPWRELMSTGAVTLLVTALSLTPLAPFARDAVAADLRRQVLLTGVVAAYVVALLIQRRLPPRTPLDLPLLALIAACAGAVYGTTDPRASLEAVVPLAGVAPLLVIAADRQVVSAEALRRGVCLSATVIAILALHSVWERWQEWLELVRAVEGELHRDMLMPPSVPRVDGVGSHPNIVASLLAISIPFLVLSLRVPHKLERWAAAAGITLSSLALFFTLSRAAWIAAAAGATVTMAGVALADGRLRRLLSRGALVAALSLAALVVMAIAAGGARPDWLFRDSLSPRADMRRTGIEIFRDNPLTGAGPGTYVSLYSEYGGAYPFAAVHSHNLVVQVAADYGLAGLAAGALLAAVVLALLVTAYRSGSPEARHAAALAAGAGTAFAVHGMADSPHLFPEVLVVLVAAVAVVVRARTPGNRPSRRLWGRIPAPVAAMPIIVMLLTTLALVPLWWRSGTAAADHQASVRAAGAGRWDEAIARARRAERRDPKMAAYPLQLGAALAGRYHAAGDEADRAAAIAAYQRGLELQPRNGAARVDLASLLIAAGDKDQARAVVDVLRHQAGRDNLLQLAYAVLIQQLGDEPESIETYAGLLALNPTLALTPFWSDEPWRAAHYDAIVTRALERADEITGPGPAAERLRATLRIFTGSGIADEAELRAQLAAAPDDTGLRVSLGRLLTAGGRLEEAGELLKGAVSRTGDSAGARAALGDWHAAAGNLPAARREWAAAAYLGDVRAGDALGASYPDAEVPATVIALQGRLVEAVWIGRFYLLFQTFRFTFMRHEPAPIIGPGDWLNALPVEFATWQENLARWLAARAAGPSGEGRSP